MCSVFVLTQAIRDSESIQTLQRIRGHEVILQRVSLDVHARDAGFAEFTECVRITQ